MKTSWLKARLKARLIAISTARKAFRKTGKTQKIITEQTVANPRITVTPLVIKKPRSTPLPTSSGTVFTSVTSCSVIGSYSQGLTPTIQILEKSGPYELLFIAGSKFLRWEDIWTKETIYTYLTGQGSIAEVLVTLGERSNGRDHLERCVILAVENFLRYQFKPEEPGSEAKIQWEKFERLKKVVFRMDGLPLSAYPMLKQELRKMVNLVL